MGSSNSITSKDNMSSSYGVYKYYQLKLNKTYSDYMTVLLCRGEYSTNITLKVKNSDGDLYDCIISYITNRTTVNIGYNTITFEIEAISIPILEFNVMDVVAYIINSCDFKLIRSNITLDFNLISRSNSKYVVGSHHTIDKFVWTTITTNNDYGYNTESVCAIFI